MGNNRGKVGGNCREGRNNRKERVWIIIKWGGIVVESREEREGLITERKKKDK